MTAGSNNPRKRAREVAASIGVSSSAPMNPIFSLQSQQAPQLIDLSQLHNNNHQPNVVSTGLRLSFGDQRQQQLQHQQQQQQQQQHVCHSSSPFLSVITEDYASQIKQQRDEIEQFLQAQVLIFLFALMVFFFWVLVFNKRCGIEWFQ